MKLPQLATLLVSLSVLTFSAVSQANALLPDSLPRPGGHRYIPSTDNEAQMAGQFAAKALGNSLSKIKNVSKQVVAGMNFRMQIVLANGAEYDVVVYRDLQNRFKLTSSKMLKSANHPIAGGNSATSPYSPEVKAAAQFAANAMGRKVTKILKAESQVVAGMNYHMLLALDDGSEYQVTVYRDLQKKMKLSALQRVK